MLRDVSVGVGIKQGLGGGSRESMPESVLVRVEEDAFCVVVARAAVGVQGEDVWSNGSFDVEVRRIDGRRGGREAEDGHRARVRGGGRMSVDVCAALFF